MLNSYTGLKEPRSEGGHWVPTTRYQRLGEMEIDLHAVPGHQPNQRELLGLIASLLCSESGANLTRASQFVGHLITYAEPTEPVVSLAAQMRTIGPPYLASADEKQDWEQCVEGVNRWWTQIDYCAHLDLAGVGWDQLVSRGIPPLVASAFFVLTRQGSNRIILNRPVMAWLRRYAAAESEAVKLTIPLDTPQDAVTYKQFEFLARRSAKVWWPWANAAQANILIQLAMVGTAPHDDRVDDFISPRNLRAHELRRRRSQELRRARKEGRIPETHKPKYTPEERQAREAASLARRKKRRYYERKDAGLCTRCGAPASEGKILCQACATTKYTQKRNWYRHKEKKRKQDKERRQRRKELGLCLECPAKAEPGKLLCTDCLTKDRQRNREPSRDRMRKRRAASPQGEE